MFNPWWHIRLAGSLIVIAAIFVPEFKLKVLLTILGLGVQYTGVFGGLDRVERLLDTLIEKDKDNTFQRLLDTHKKEDDSAIHK